MRIFRLFGELIQSFHVTSHLFPVFFPWHISPSTRFHPFRPSDDFLCYNCVKEAFQPGGQLVMVHDRDRNRRLCLKNITNKKRFEEPTSFQSFTVDVSKNKNCPFDPQVLETTLTVESVLVGIFALHSFSVVFFFKAGFSQSIIPTFNQPRVGQGMTIQIPKAFCKNTPRSVTSGFCDRRQLQWSLCFFFVWVPFEGFFWLQRVFVQLWSPHGKEMLIDNS